MMQISDYLTDNDLKLMGKILMPDYRDKNKLVKILREDKEIFKKMLSDNRLFIYIMNTTNTYMEISPAFLFSVLLRHMKNELITHPYTLENKNGESIAVFDSKSLLNLLEKEKNLDYLTGMLVSFARIHNYSTMHRVKKGIWRRLNFSDFDIDSLIRYSRSLEKKLRFRPFKKVGDICLFILGVFPEYVETHDWPLSFGDRRIASHPKIRKIGFENYGKYYYRTASYMETSYKLGLHDILIYLSENFETAEKTLIYLTNRYFAFHDKKRHFPI